MTPDRAAPAQQQPSPTQPFDWKTVTRPPHSASVVPSEFYLFPELNKQLGGRETHFDTDEKVEERVLHFCAARRGIAMTSLKYGCSECKNALIKTANSEMCKIIKPVFLCEKIM